MQRMLKQLSLLSIVGFSLAFVVGCGPPVGQKVTGSVMMDGKPQEGAVVSFIPSLPADSNTPGGAATNAEGKFEAKLLPGKYSVVLSKKVDKSGKVPGNSDNANEDFGQLEAAGLLRQVFPAKYTQPANTPIKVDVPAAGIDLPPFEVTK